jgi:glutamyl-Q tRNA(Asp) synthetase
MQPYVGRFAPSPTGPLHQGSLVAALASYLDAKVHGGRWLLRIDDADLSRVQAGSAQTIAAQLKHYGFVWDGDITHTQDFRAQHEAALKQLQAASRVYACACTRAKLSTGSKGTERAYSGICRHLSVPPDACRALRLKASGQSFGFFDRWQGACVPSLGDAVDDIVLWRPKSVIQFAGGLYSYQFTMPCDDAAQGVTHVVRGADLLSSTARQLAIYDALQLKRPQYLHVPVVTMEGGLKLSKQNHAPPLPSTDPIPAVQQALTHLGCESSQACNLAAFWRSACAAWEKRLSQLAELN